MNEFIGHKFSEDGRFYIIRGSIIDINNIESIVPEYHNNKRSLYLKVLKKDIGKTIIKVKNKEEYNFIVSTINSKTNRNDLEVI